MAFTVDRETRVLKNPVTGALQSVPAAKADSMAADQGLEYATSAEINAANLAERRGGAGQVALGAAETALRSVTAGQVQSLDPEDTEGARERAQHLEREHPVIDTAAQYGPAVIASVATGGGSVGAVAAQSAIGGIANLGAAQEEAFRRDESLSAEAAWGAFGSGVLLGAAAELGGAALARGARGVRNRFVEAASGAARKVEAEAFEKAGLVRPAKDLAKAVDDPVHAAALRERANAARAAAKPEFEQALSQADAAHQVVASTTPSGLSLDVAGDVVRQRHLVRNIVVGLRDDLAHVSDVGGDVASQAMAALDNANSPAEVYDMLLRIRGTLKAAADTSDNPKFASIVTKYADAANELAESKTAWGAPANDVAEVNATLREVAQARASLDDALAQGDYFSTVGTLGGKPVDDALSLYADRLEVLLKGHAAPEAKQGFEAIGRLRSLQTSQLRDVAAGNQIDALAKTAAPAAPPKGMGADLLGELAETAVESIVPGAGLVRKAWKYRKQIGQLVTGARSTTERTAAALLAGSHARATERALAGSGVQAIAGASRRAMRGGATASLFFADLDSDPDKAYSKVRDAVTQLAENPGALVTHLAAQTGDLATEAPELYGALAARGAAAVDFLRAHIPPSFGFSMLYPDGPPPARSDILELSLYWRGATDGVGTMQRIGSGEAMPEEMEAFRAVFPDWYAELQETTLITAQQDARNGKVLGAFQVAHLENALELHGQLDPTFSDTVAQVYQDANARNVEQKRQLAAGAPKPNAGDRLSEKATAT